MAIPDKPLNRIEKYLAKWAGDTVSIPAEPLNRLEKYLAKIAGQNVQTPTPLCRIEDYLDAIIGNIQWTEITNQSVATFTSAIAAELSKLEIAITPVQSGSGDPAPDNVRPITGWTQAKIFVEAAYDASATPKAVIDLGDTIYGGTLDVTTGVLTVKWKRVNLGDESWSDTTIQAAGGHAYRCAISDRRYGSDGSGVYGLCDSYKFFGNGTSSVISSDILNYQFAYYRTTNHVVIRNDDYATKEAMTEALNGVYLVYELDAPQTVQLTPAQVETLVGANAVWADTGDILTLKYREV